MRQFMQSQTSIYQRTAQNSNKCKLKHVPVVRASHVGLEEELAGIRALRVGCTGARGRGECSRSRTSILQYGFTIALYYYLNVVSSAACSGSGPWRAWFDVRRVGKPRPTP